MKSFQEVMDLWPSRAAFMSDVQAKPVTVYAMYARDSIASKYWAAIVLAAQERGIDGVTLTRLASIADAKRKLRVAA